MEETHIDNYPPAVWVRNACKQYSAKKNPVVVLNHLNLTVPKGCIYGLLGASGCGKTTLLNCILNFKKIDSGKILIFGGIPGTEDSGVPGPLVGYMPQELALGPSFSIMESLKYYGWIAGLQNAEITQRTNVLAKLLVLPDLTSKIIYLSGGQQRRVSLACALIHQPQLLILDEPTVGLDSILRQEIWDYLQQLSKKMVTIIITTHYIEETRQADMVGFMRGGNILTEDSPDNVLRRFNEPTLEKVFLKLSIMQNFDQHELIVTDGNGNGIIDLDDVDAQSIEIKNNANFSKQEYFEKLNRIVNPHQLKRIRIKAQLWKHLLWMKQNHISVLFFILLGVSQVSFFCLTVGHNPSHVPVSVYNSESIDCREVSLKMECNSTKLSCVYLKYLENSIYKLVYHKSEKSALDSVSSGKTYATIIIKPDYSKALHNRINKWYFTSSSEIEQSEISVIRDNTNAEVSEYITLYLYKNFQTFLQNYLESCNFKKKFFAYPVKIEDAIYALNEPDFTEYFLPGFVVTLMILMGTGLTATSILTEKRIGDLERNQVVGVKISEIVAAYIVTESVLLNITIITIMMTLFWLFGVTLKGSIGTVYCLFLNCGLCGMAYGIVIAAVCEKEFTALFFCAGSLMPLVILSGIIWPLQGMHVVLQWIAHIFPVYIGSEAFRNITQKGWGWEKAGVYKGFLTMSIWTLTFLLISFIYIKFFRNR